MGDPKGDGSTTITIDYGTGTTTISGFMVAGNTSFVPSGYYGHSYTVPETSATTIKESTVNKLLMMYIRRTMELIDQDMEDCVDEDTLHEVLAELDPDHDPSRPLELILADLEKKAETSS